MLQIAFYFIISEKGFSLIFFYHTNEWVEIFVSPGLRAYRLATNLQLVSTFARCRCSFMSNTIKNRLNVYIVSIEFDHNLEQTIIVKTLVLVPSKTEKGGYPLFPPSDVFFFK